MKKVLAVVLSVICLLTAFSFIGSAEGEIEKIKFHVLTPVAGTDASDGEALVEYDPAQLVHRPERYEIFDFAGKPFTGTLAPGRTYYVRYSFSGAPGFQMPLAVLDGYNMELQVDSGAKVVWYGITLWHDDVPASGFFLKLTVPGTPWQRFTGALQDFWIKLLSDFTV